MYIRLMQQKAELEGRPKSKNPLTAIANYRAARVFLAASRSLYFATKVTILTIERMTLTLKHIRLPTRTEPI